MSDNERAGLEALRSGSVSLESLGFDPEEVKASAIELVALGATLEEAFSLGLILGVKSADQVVPQEVVVALVEEVAESVRSPLRRGRRRPRPGR